MDYAFYLKAIATISPEQLAALQAHVAHLPFAASPYFSLQPDDGYSTVRKVINSDKVTVDPIDPVVEDALKDLPFFKLNKLWYYEFNKLEAHKEFHEHTDVKNKNNNGVHVVKCHCLHIPITGDSTYMWRRDRRNEFEEEKMELGKVYVFNNYVPHKITNNGDTSRTNLLIFFKDNMWEAKTEMYQHYGIPRGI